MLIEGGSKLNGVKRKSISPKEKLLIGTKCVNCGSTENLRYHHIIPLSMGGMDILSNMCCLCEECHNKVHWTQDGGIDTRLAAAEGKKKALASGVKLGRKPADREPIFRAIAEHSTAFAGGDWTETEIMKHLGLHQTMYSKYKRLLYAELGSSNWQYSFEKPRLIRNRPLYDHFIKKCRKDGTIDDVIRYKNIDDGEVDYGTEY